MVVSFGSATLLLTDLEERPLGHWALAGVTRARAATGGATVYAMTADGGETLAIRDRDMVAAIAAVARPRSRRAGREPPRRRRVPVAAPGARRGAGRARRRRAAGGARGHRAD